MAYFWSGNELKDFLFKGFDINETDGLATLCIALVGSAIFYEGLRTARDGLLSKFVDKRRRANVITSRPTRLKVPSHQQQDAAHSSATTPQDYGGCGDIGDATVSLMRSPLDDDDYELRAKSGDEFTALQVKSRRTESCKHFSLLIISTLFHVIYISIGYAFMLAVMTFNVWILVSIAIGVGIGQLIFGVFKRSDIFRPSASTLIFSSSGQPSSDSEVFLQTSEAGSGLGDVAASTSGGGGPPIKINASGDGQVNDYYSNSSGSEGHHQHSEHLTAEITVHNTSTTPDNHVDTSSVSP